MKIAVLINHNTASKFYCEIFKSLGHEVYIPLKCDYENYTLQGNDVKKYRNINDENIIDILDNFNFYSNKNNNIHNIINIFNNYFDVIITLHVINQELNRQLSLINKKVYYILWGAKYNNNPYTLIHRNILNNENKYYLFCHKFLLNNIEIKFKIPKNKIKFLRLGLIQMSSFENTYSVNNNDLLIIISRIHLNGLNDKLIFIKKLSKHIPNINIHIVGKDNNIDFNEPNIIKHDSFEKEEDLLNFIKNFKLNLNINHDPNIIQYSTLELSCINMPIIYSKSSSLSKIIEYDNIFQYENFQELCQIIIYFMNTDNLLLHKEVYENNNRIIYENYKFTNIINDYQII